MPGLSFCIDAADHGLGWLCLLCRFRGGNKAIASLQPLTSQKHQHLLKKQRDCQESFQRLTLSRALLHPPLTSKCNATPRFGISAQSKSSSSSFSSSANSERGSGGKSGCKRVEGCKCHILLDNNHTDTSPTPNRPHPPRSGRDR